MMLVVSMGMAILTSILGMIPFVGGTFCIILCLDCLSFGVHGLDEGAGGISETAP